MNIKKKVVVLAATAALATMTAACEIPETEGTAADRTDVSGAAGGGEKQVGKQAGKQGKNKKGKVQDEQKEEEEVAFTNETASQEQARTSAADYLDYTGFSRSGLIEQLEYEGYSTEDATYGVDAQKADWGKQAGLSAKEYLDYTSFSRAGLIDQLKFEGYTQEQAEAGVAAVGLS